MFNTKYTKKEIKVLLKNARKFAEKNMLAGVLEWVDYATRMLKAYEGTEHEDETLAMIDGTLVKMIEDYDAPIL